MPGGNDEWRNEYWPSAPTFLKRLESFSMRGSTDDVTVLAIPDGTEAALCPMLM